MLWLDSANRSGKTKGVERRSKAHRRNRKMQNIVEKNVETISYLKLVEDEGYNSMSQEQIPFFYISDIHL